MGKCSSNAFRSINKNTEKKYPNNNILHYLAHTERLSTLDMKKTCYAKNNFDNVQKLLKYFAYTSKLFI